MAGLRAAIARADLRGYVAAFQAQRRGSA